MHRLFLALGVAIFAAATIAPAWATDLAVRPQPRERQVVEQEIPIVRGQECLRWIRQNQSWYNYCDPIPYYGLPPSHYEYWGAFAHRE